MRVGKKLKKILVSGLVGRRENRCNFSREGGGERLAMWTLYGERLIMFPLPLGTTPVKETFIFHSNTNLLVP